MNTFEETKLFVKQANDVLKYLSRDTTENSVIVDVRFYDGLTYTTLPLAIDFMVLQEAVHEVKEKRVAELIKLVDPDG